jgi:AbrB family looped-hinge helix DNA binding protein
MELTIDNFGRVVLPKSVRDRIGVKAGDRLTLSEDEGGIRLEPAHPEPQVRRKDNGILVLSGMPL